MPFQTKKAYLIKQYLLFFLFIGFPTIVFTASSGYTAWVLWGAKSAQAPELPQDEWFRNIGKDVTIAMKLAVVSSGYLCLFFLYRLRAQIRFNRIVFQVLCILAMIQGLLCLNYVTRFNWFFNSGLVSKGLVTAGFILIICYLFSFYRRIRLAPTPIALNQIFFLNVSELSHYQFLDLTQYFLRILQSNRKAVVTFIFSYFFVVIVYGSKLFFTSYATDDYNRFFFFPGWWDQASWNGRWAASLLHRLFFSGAGHILPYFNTLLSLFSIVLSAWFTIKIWEVKRRELQFAVICLISISPYFAGLLYFNTSVSVYPGILLSVFAVYISLKNVKLILISLLLSSFAIGVYQTALQIQLIIIIIWFLINLGINFNRKTLIIFLTLTAMILLSYLIYRLTNEAIVVSQNQSYSGRYEVAKNQNAAGMLKNALTILRTRFIIYLDYFTNSFTILQYLIVIIAGFIILTRGVVPFILFILLLIPLRLVLNLPQILLGYPGPTRAFLHVGWAIAGFYTLIYKANNYLLRFFSNILCVLIVLLSSIYISRFYDAANRQTQNDIIRINQIVNRIRLSPDYESEDTAIPFMIVGTKSYAVTGWSFNQQALNTDWSKYDAFRHFTDFNFRLANEEEQLTILQRLNGAHDLAEYPSKGSIRFIDGAVILILDETKVSDRSR